MVFEIGILFALAALVFWGFGDFLIQRSTRKFGDWGCVPKLLEFNFSSQHVFCV